MYKFGETFRMLRKERGYTLKTMSKNIISYSYLSKFEKGESEITLVNFIRLIERLNLTLDEFLYFNNLVTTNYVTLFRKVSKSYLKNEKKKLQSYYRQELELFKQTKIIYHRCNYIMIGTIIKDINSDFYISQKDIDFFIDYIVKCTFWTTYEVSLIGNTLVLFPEKLLLILLKEIKMRIKNHMVAERSIRDLISLIENACLVLLRKKNVNKAKELSNFIESYLFPNHYFEKTRKLFIDGIILIWEEKSTEGVQKAQEAINIMHSMDRDFAMSHQKELEYFMK